MKEPKFRSATKQATDALAIKLGLPNHSNMQDWAYEVANPADVNKYFEIYERTTDADEKFVLMEMIIQAVNDQQNKITFNASWKKLEPLLSRDFEIHAYTIFYWALFDEVDSANIWTITPSIREVWTECSLRSDMPEGI